MAKVGFIGLGIMGRPMALNLIKGSHQLFLHSRSGVPQELAAAGGNVCNSPKEVAQQADIIITMLPDTPDVENALFGESGVVQGLSPSKIIVDMSSIAPIEPNCLLAKSGSFSANTLTHPFRVEKLAQRMRLLASW